MVWSIKAHCTKTSKLLCFTDLYACKSNPLTTNSSVILDRITSVHEKGKRGFKRRVVLNTTVCLSHSSSNQYLEIQLKHFYDVCAVTTWTDITRLTDTNFTIKVSHNGHSWYYYHEMGKVKVIFFSMFIVRPFWSESLRLEQVDVVSLILCLL